jgi:hypothetical protein
MTKNFLILLAAGIIAMVASSCDGNKGPKITLADQKGDSEPMKFAKNHFRTVCVSCHGTRGRGDGIAGKLITPPPRSFGKRSWQDGVSDERIAKVIIEGGPSVGLHPLMTANTEIRVEEDPEVLDALVKIIRSFGR